MNVSLIGLGNMGFGIAANLAKAGMSVKGFDLNPEALARAKAAGVEPADSLEECLDGADCVSLCLLGHVATKVALEEVLPRVGGGAVKAVIDHSTFSANESRRLAKAFGDAGTVYLDAQISGGKKGSEAGELSVFVGGEKTVFEALEDYWSAIGDEERIHYCGASGSGQVAKAIQNLQSWCSWAQRVEIMAFGLRRGFSKELVVSVCKDAPDMKRIADWIEEDHRDRLNCLPAEWPYFVDEAENDNSLPMLRAAWEFAKTRGEPFTDFLGRETYDFWKALLDPPKPGKPKPGERSE